MRAKKKKSGRLTHVDERGAARMVDVGGKVATERRALAEGLVRLAPATRVRVRKNQMEKGDVLATARIAAISATKRTAELIPLCHPLRIDAVSADLVLTGDGVRVRVEVRAHDRTGVEMEALTGVAVGCLVVYDMVKAMDRTATIGDVRLLEKDGGKSGAWRRTARPPRKSSRGRTTR